MACWSQTALNGLWHEISLEKTVAELWNRLRPELTGVSHSVCFDSRWPKTIPPNLWDPQADSCKLLPGVVSPHTGRPEMLQYPQVTQGIYKTGHSLGLQRSVWKLTGQLISRNAGLMIMLTVCLYVWRQVLLYNPDWPVTQRYPSAFATPVVGL